MTDFVVMTWMAGTMDEARRVGRFLVQEHQVACVNIIPWVESIFLWDGQLQTEQESKVTIKTHSSKVEEVKKTILQNSSYEVPEILVFPIEGGNCAYLEWLGQACSGSSCCSKKSSCCSH